MRKIIQQQLEKVEYADLSNLKEGEPFIIPKRLKNNNQKHCDEFGENR